MASPPSPSTPTPPPGWSVYRWIRGWISGASSMIAEDGDHDERMLDDLNFMELRDGKRLSSRPWAHSNGSQLGSEFDDEGSMVSAQMFQAEYSLQEDRVSQSSSLSRSLATASGDTGFSTLGRRILSFAECQQLPKTDYMYAYTQVYSPNIYRNRDIEMPNMCRSPIRSSSQLMAGTPARDFQLRQRSAAKEAVGEIPLYGTDFDDGERAPVSQPVPQTPRFALFRRLYASICIYFLFALTQCKLTITDRLIPSLTFWFLNIFVTIPVMAFSSVTRKSSEVVLVSWYWFVFCVTRPVAMATTTASSTASVAKEKWHELALKVAQATSKCKEASMTTGVKTAFWLQRAFLPLLLLAVLSSAVYFFPYGAVYQKSVDWYNEIDTAKYNEYFKWPESPPPVIVTTQPPPVSQIEQPPIPMVAKMDCPECWKSYSQQVQKMLADRDKEIFSNLDLKLANAAAMAVENSEAKFTAASERLVVLENAIAQLRQAIADARTEAKRTFDDAELMRKDVREEDRANLQSLVDEMWHRVDAKLTASSDAFERKLLEQQTVTENKMEETASRISLEMQRAVDDTRKLATDAMARADEANEAVASIPPPPPPQPVKVECKTACPSTPTPSGAALTASDVESIVNGAISRYDADRTGLPDFALESSGGSVVSVRCSKTYDMSSGIVSIFGFPVYFDTKSPRTAIQAGPLVPGNCWAFSGSRGFLVVRLSYRIFVSSISLEHIPKELAPMGRLDSAPRDFSVYALANESDTVGRLLGNYTYDAVNGSPLQTFDSSEQSESAQYIELRVLSNYGHPTYTCIYRLRVHGHPADGAVSSGNAS